MRQLKIIVDSRQGSRRFVLGRFWSAVVGILVLLMATSLVIATFIFGYLLLGVVLAILLLAMALALIRAFIQGVRP
jgi:hypothetical protein